MGLLKAAGKRLAGYGPVVTKKLEDWRGTVNLVGKIGISVGFAYPFVYISKE